MKKGLIFSLLLSLVLCSGFSFAQEIEGPWVNGLGSLSNVKYHCPHTGYAWWNLSVSSNQTLAQWLTSHINYSNCCSGIIVNGYDHGSYS